MEADRDTFICDTSYETNNAVIYDSERNNFMWNIDMDSCFHNNITSNNDRMTVAAKAMKKVDPMERDDSEEESMLLKKLGIYGNSALIEENKKICHKSFHKGSWLDYLRRITKHVMELESAGIIKASFVRVETNSNLDQNKNGEEEKKNSESESIHCTHNDEENVPKGDKRYRKAIQRHVESDPNKRHVVLNAGGKYLVTTLDTLQSPRSKVLSAIFSHNPPLARQDANGAYFIDAYPDIFVHIVNRLKILESSFDIPPDGIKAGLWFEACAYYEIEVSEAHLSFHLLHAQEGFMLGAVTAINQEIVVRIWQDVIVNSFSFRDAERYYLPCCNFYLCEGMCSYEIREDGSFMRCDNVSSDRRVIGTNIFDLYTYMDDILETRYRTFKEEGNDSCIASYLKYLSKKLGIKGIKYHPISACALQANKKFIHNCYDKTKDDWKLREEEFFVKVTLKFV